MPTPSRQKKLLTLLGPEAQHGSRRNNQASACNGVTVELLNPCYSDLKRDFERLIGRPHLDGEKLVRNCQLFAFGACPTCGNNHPTQRLIRYAKNTLASTNAAPGAEQPRDRTVSALAAELITDQPPNRAHRPHNDGRKGQTSSVFPLDPFPAVSRFGGPQSRTDFHRAFRWRTLAWSSRRSSARVGSRRSTSGCGGISAGRLLRGVLRHRITRPPGDWLGCP